jgi:hypothetical protein
MYDREDFIGIADQIVAWEIVAQQMPLPDLTAMLGNCQNELAHSLNAFQDLYDHADHVPADTLKEAIGAIARLATTTAIFALGLSQRARLAAQQN